MILLFAGVIYFLNRNKNIQTIKIGLLFSLTGDRAPEEKYLVEATQILINEINQKGGVLGHPLELVIADGKSNNATYASEAERLILNEKVVLLIGCTQSDCLRSVESIVEREHSLLFFPSSYEGFEKSQNIIYFGSVPNQQVSPGISWAMDHIGKSAYLVGNKNINSIASLQIARDMIVAQNGQLLGESLIDFSSTYDFQKLIKEIKQKKPKFIFNSLSGDSNQIFFKELLDQGLSEIPVFSQHLNEYDLNSKLSVHFNNLYSLVNYFQHLNIVANQQWLQKLKENPMSEILFKNHLLTEEFEAIYTAISMWMEVTTEKKTFDPLQINTDKLLHLTFIGPSGVISVDARTRHVWRPARVSKVDSNGEFTIVSESPFPIKPAPWPVHRSREDWENLKLKWIKSLEVKK